ncbi:MAG: phage tail protein [Omnitrophica bacterium]|nr:phage tail protein [Candidatus Omnitrophota bacterium]
MKIKTLLFALAIAVSLAAASYATIPHVINFQGRATDANGAPLNGTYNLIVRIYNHATAGDPAAPNDPYRKWTETYQNLTIINGIFSILLGSVTPLNLPFDEDYWISVQIGTDSEMSPRTRLASVGYAYKAEKAEHAVSADSLTVEIEGVPSGGIIMWSGSIASIPVGWVLCDGNNGTPDLRDKFIIAASQDEGTSAKTNIEGSLKLTGGNTNHGHSVDRQSFATSGTNGTDGRTLAIKIQGVYGAGNNGSTNTVNHIPTYYALAFIMKS